MTPTFPLLPAALLPPLLAPCSLFTSPFCLAPSSSLSVAKSSLPFVVSGVADGFFSGKSAAKKDSAQNQFPVHTGSASPNFALELLPVNQACTCYY